MKQQDKQRLQDRTRGGRDELNLTEFPIALLSDRPSKKTPASLRFKAGDKIWEISGHPDYGLPTAGDVAVYVCLMELTREQEYTPRVRFTRHDLLQRLGWSRGANEYARLQLALDRLVGVTITTTNAYYDARDRQWLRRHAFHLLEEYKIIDVRQAAAADEPASWFRWSEAISRNLQAGYIKTLNVPLFLSLKSSISQTLYRYLDAKVRDGKSLFRQGLRDLAHEHLGLSRDYYPSQIKRKLAPAHEELIAAGFLAGADYARMQDGEEMVVYRFPGRQALEDRRQASGVRREPSEGRREKSDVRRQLPVDGQESAALGAASGPLNGDRDETSAVEVLSDALRLTPDACPPPPDASRLTPHASLVARLVEAGVTRAAARRLVEADPEGVEQQLAYWPYRETKSNPAGALRRAIEEEWPAPPRWQQAQKKARATRPARRNEPLQAELIELPDPADAAFDAWWAGLPAAEQAAYTESARQELIGNNPVLAQHFQRNPDSLPKAVRPILIRMAGEGVVGRQ